MHEVHSPPLESSPRWPGKLQEGVYNLLVHCGKLRPYQLTPGEALFVLELIATEHDVRKIGKPAPPYRIIAERMGVSSRAVTRYAKSLESKGYLQRVQRPGGANISNLEGLFEALDQAIENQSVAGRRRQHVA